MRGLFTAADLDGGNAGIRGVVKRDLGGIVERELKGVLERVELGVGWLQCAAANAVHLASLDEGKELVGLLVEERAADLARLVEHVNGEQLAIALGVAPRLHVALSAVRTAEPSHPNTHLLRHAHLQAPAGVVGRESLDRRDVAACT